MKHNATKPNKFVYINSIVDLILTKHDFKQKLHKVTMGRGETKRGRERINIAIFEAECEIIMKKNKQSKALLVNIADEQVYTGRCQEGG